MSLNDETLFDLESALKAASAGREQIIDLRSYLDHADVDRMTKNGLNNAAGELERAARILRHRLAITCHVKGYSYPNDRK